MAKVHVEIIHKETADFDIGDLSPLMIAKLLEQGNGSFGDSEYSIGDLGNKDHWEVQSITVNSIGK